MQKKKTDTTAALGNLMDKARAQFQEPTPPASVSTPHVAAPSGQVQPPAQGARSCTFRLTGSEMQKISAVTLATHQATGARLTTTDVLHIALKLLPETAIGREEVDRLRAQDKRRRQL